MTHSVAPTNQDLKDLMGSHKHDQVTGAYHYFFSCARNYEGKMFAYNRIKEHLEEKYPAKSQANPPVTPPAETDWVVVPK
jgi:hypothetical protein